jgi:uncharacterized protein YebE (UPF0316 family)
MKNNKIKYLQRLLYLTFTEIYVIIREKIRKEARAMTRMILMLGLIFFAGFIVDLLTTKYTQSVAEKKVWYATLLSGLITVVNYGVLAYLLVDGLNLVHNIVAYGVGNTFGTYLVMKRKI